MHIFKWRTFAQREQRKSRTRLVANFSATAILSRQLHIEPLERRQLLSAVSWDGGGDGMNWTDPLNWSGNKLPDVGDDVTISVAGAITVTHGRGNTEINSITSDENLVINSGANFRLKRGASIVNGSFRINSANLWLTGATTSFTAAGAANIDGSSLYAATGAQLNLTSATAFVESTYQSYISATDPGSKIDLSGVTSITGAGNTLIISAGNGGKVELDNLTTLTARDVNVGASGAGSVVDLSRLTSSIDPAGLGYLSVSNGGTLHIPALTAYNRDSINVINMSATFPALTNINGTSVRVSAGGPGISASLSLPAVTSWSGGIGLYKKFEVYGANSKLDLSGITSIADATSALYISASTGGEINLDGLTTITASHVGVGVSTPNSLVKLSALLNWTDATSLGSIEVSNSGKVQLGSSTTLAGVTMAVHLSGTIDGGIIRLNSPGSLKGSGGTIQANLINYANVLRGTTQLNLNFIGDYSQTSAGRYSVELYGLTPGPAYDRITVQGTVALDGTLTIKRGFTPAIGDSFTIIDNDGADAVIGTFFDAPEGDIYTVNGIPFRISYVGGDGNDVTLTRVANTVVGRLLFYNQSGTPTRYDGNNAAINAADDLAIASDKAAYLWEDAGAATFANVSSYSKGINGIMVDLAGPRGSISAADFVFRVGNNNSPGLWDLANAPTSISVRAGAGRRGSDRIEIIWTSGAPINQWLEVITLANSVTGLPQKVGHPVSHGDAFFYGSAAGNTGAGDSPTNSLVNEVDATGIRSNPAMVSANIAITNIYDVNRSGSVNASDESVVRLNGTNSTNATEYLNLSSAPAAPEVDDDIEIGVASALAALSPSSELGGAPRLQNNWLNDKDLNSWSAARLFQHLHDTNRPRVRPLLQKFDAVAEVLVLDDILLESLLTDLGLE